MNIIKSQRGKRRWISGIFKNQKDAEHYYEKIPQRDEQSNELLAIEVKKYPIYIIESAELGFYFHDLDSVTDFILNYILSNKLGEDDVYFSMYVVFEDFAPEKPGTDYMGSIRHYHVDKSFIQWVIKRGVKSYSRKS